jgi:Peroxisome biogenesis factor 1, N-terminal
MNESDYLSLPLNKYIYLFVLRVEHNNCHIPLRLAAKFNSANNIDVLICRFLHSPWSICFITCFSGILVADSRNDYVELPKCLFPDDDVLIYVQVRSLPEIESALTLTVEPLTCDDWELLEMEAAWLEEGGFLQQASVVFPNEVLNLRLSNGTDTACVRVLPDSFDKDKDRVNVWPDVDTTRLLPCLRLVADTQLVVVPKPREAVSVASECVLRIHPSVEIFEDNPVMIELAHVMAIALPSVSQRDAAVHPETLKKLTWGHTSIQSEPLAFVRLSSSNGPRIGSESVVVQMVSSSSVPKESIGMYSFI